MVGVYAQLRSFILAHRACPGSRHTGAQPPTAAGYRLVVICGCGKEFKRWVTLDDVDENLLRTALLAFAD
jgi:hypothetical protein